MASLLKVTGIISSDVLYAYLNYDTYNTTNTQRLAQIFTVSGSGDFSPMGMNVYAPSNTNVYAVSVANKIKWRLQGTSSGAPDDNNIIIDWQDPVLMNGSILVASRGGGFCDIGKYLTEPLQKGTKYALVLEQTAHNTYDPRVVCASQTLTDWQGYSWDGSSWVSGTLRGGNNWGMGLLYFDGNVRYFILADGVSGWQPTSQPNTAIGGPTDSLVYYNGSTNRQAGIRYNVAGLDLTGKNGYLDSWTPTGDTDVLDITVNFNRLNTKVESTTTYNTRGSYASTNALSWVEESADATLLGFKELHVALNADHLVSAGGKGFWLDAPNQGTPQPYFRYRYGTTTFPTLLLVEIPATFMSQAIFIN